MDGVRNNDERIPGRRLRGGETDAPDRGETGGAAEKVDGGRTFSRLSPILNGGRTTIQKDC